MSLTQSSDEVMSFNNLFGSFAVKVLGVLVLSGLLASGFLAITTSSAHAQTLKADLNPEFFAESSQKEMASLPSDTNDEIELAQANTTNEADQCNYLTDNLRIDRKNNQEQVLRLQAFLQAYAYDYVELTGTFDEPTLQAVRAFQARHAEDVLEPWGYEPDEATGYVYITTKDKINEIYCNQSFELTAEETAEVNQYRQQLNTWRQQGASFETPQYLRQYDPQLAARTAPDTGESSTSGSVAGEADEELAQVNDGTQDNQNDTNEATSSVSENDDSQSTTTTTDDSDERGFFDRLFGSNDEQSTSSEESNNQSTSTDNGDGSTASTTTGDGQSGTATSLDRAATSVYSGVNSVVSFILSPTFLLILLGLLILLLIATLLEEEDDDNDDYGELYQTEGDDGDDDQEQENEFVDEDDDDDMLEDAREEKEAESVDQDDTNQAQNKTDENEKTKSANFEESDFSKTS